MDILYILLTIFAFRALELLFKKRIANTLGINLSSGSYDSGAVSAPYMVTLPESGGTLQDGNGSPLNNLRVQGNIVGGGGIEAERDANNTARVRVDQAWGGVQRWWKNNPSSGSGQVFNTDIRVSARSSHLVLISYKRTGTNRLDTQLRIVNRLGDAGADEDWLLHSTDNLGELDSVSFSVNGSNQLILTVDLGSNGDQLTVTALG